MMDHDIRFCFSRLSLQSLRSRPPLSLCIFPYLNTVISSQPDKLRLFGATKGQHKSGIPSFYSSLPFSHNASQFCTDIFLRVSDSWQPAFQRMDNGSLITDEMSKSFYFLYPCAAEQGPLCSSRRDRKRIRKTSSSNENKRHGSRARRGFLRSASFNNQGFVLPGPMWQNYSPPSCVVSSAPHRYTE